MIVYMLVTRDIYELPILICDTVAELAQKAGVKENTIYHGISECDAGKRKRCRWRRVDIGGRKRK